MERKQKEFNSDDIFIGRLKKDGGAEDTIVFRDVSAFKIEDENLFMITREGELKQLDFPIVDSIVSPLLKADEIDPKHISYFGASILPGSKIDLDRINQIIDFQKNLAIADQTDRIPTSSLNYVVDEHNKTEGLKNCYDMISYEKVKGHIEDYFGVMPEIITQEERERLQVICKAIEANRVSETGI